MRQASAKQKVLFDNYKSLLMRKRKEIWFQEYKNELPICDCKNVLRLLGKQTREEETNIRQQMEVLWNNIDHNLKDIWLQHIKEFRIMRLKARFSEVYQSTIPALVISMEDFERRLEEKRRTELKSQQSSSSEFSSVLFPAQNYSYQSSVISHKSGCSDNICGQSCDQNSGTEVKEAVKIKPYLDNVGKYSKNSSKRTLTDFEKMRTPVSNTHFKVNIIALREL